MPLDKVFRKSKKKKEKNKKRKKPKRTRNKIESEGSAQLQKRDDAASESSIPSSVSAAVSVSLDTNIAAASSSLSCASVASVSAPQNTGWSWGMAFEAAATIRPNDADLDERFLLRNTAADPSSEGGEISRISELAVEQQACSAAVGNDTNEPTTSDPARMLNDVGKRCTKKLKKDKKKKRKKDEEAIVVPVATPKINTGDLSGSDSGTMSEDNEKGRKKKLKKDKRKKRKNYEEEITVSAAISRVEAEGDAPKSSKKKKILKESFETKEATVDQSSARDNMQKNERSTDNQQAPINAGKICPKEPLFPFPTDPDDHCETPLGAYEDIAPLLKIICGQSTKQTSPKEISIYDPYYCDGSVVKNLSALGFPNVYNKKEDCYAAWSTTARYPSFDTLVTNPPYSGDHIERLMQHVTHPNFGERPWFLLMPNWVHKKDYYTRALENGMPRGQRRQPFYLVPKRRYVYIPPKAFREKKLSDVHKKSSPFVSMWYVWGGSTKKTSALVDCFQSFNTAAGNSIGGCDLARSKSALRDLRRVRRNTTRSP